MALTAIGEKWDQLTHSTTNWGGFQIQIQIKIWLKIQLQLPSSTLDWVRYFAGADFVSHSGHSLQSIIRREKDWKKLQDPTLGEDPCRGPPGLLFHMLLLPNPCDPSSLTFSTTHCLSMERGVDWASPSGKNCPPAFGVIDLISPLRQTVYF